MDRAIDVHDHVIRTQLGQYNGYEVTTEGDAFLLAFHEASDAIAWSTATQQVRTAT
jgi:class 3 adenylate cyclase